MSTALMMMSMMRPSSRPLICWWQVSTTHFKTGFWHDKHWSISSVLIKADIRLNIEMPPIPSVNATKAEAAGKKMWHRNHLHHPHILGQLAMRKFCLQHCHSVHVFNGIFVPTLGLFVISNIPSVTEMLQNPHCVLSSQMLSHLPQDNVFLFQSQAQSHSPF